MDHIEILCHFNIFCRNLTEFIVRDCHVNLIVNIAPLRKSSCFLALRGVSLNKISCLFEICKLEFFDEHFVAGSPARANLGEGLGGTDASCLSMGLQEIS